MSRAWLRCTNFRPLVNGSIDLELLWGQMGIEMRGNESVEEEVKVLAFAPYR